MQGLKQKYGNTALIAGASEGIGKAFATRIASEGLDLVIVARRMEPLKDLAAHLIDKYKVNVTCICCDLSLADSIEQLKEELNGREINIVIYNAALSFIGPFIKNSPIQHYQIAQVNMITPMGIFHLFGQKMLAKRKGAIILMSSLAGFQGSGYLSVYAASKAFGRILAESLWYEWKESGVDVMACCAGATLTPNYKNTKPEKMNFFAPRILAPEEVAYECLKKLGRKPSFITGRGNRFASFFMRKILPLRMAINIMGDTTRKMYRL